MDRRAKRYFNITLLIRHPDIDPDVITQRLGLQPFRCWKKGEQRTTPKGTILDGTWPHSSWTHVFRFKKDENLVEELNRILADLHEKQEFLKKLAVEADLVEVIIRLPGLVHHGFDVPNDMLTRLAEMNMTLGFEVFPDWEND